jgi:sarcosine oxidase subunit gamma
MLMAYDVTITRLPMQALFDLKGDAGVVAAWGGAVLPLMPPRQNSYSAAAGRTLHWIGPDHWILRADIAAEDALLAALDPGGAPGDLSAALISDTLAFFEITGPDADQIMAVATPLDMRSLAEDGVTLTEAFGTRAMVRRIASGYELAIDLSYAAMAAEYLDRVGS